MHAAGIDVRRWLRQPPDAELLNDRDRAQRVGVNPQPHSNCFEALTECLRLGGGRGGDPAGAPTDHAAYELALTVEREHREDELGGRRLGGLGSVTECDVLEEGSVGRGPASTRGCTEATVEEARATVLQRVSGLDTKSGKGWRGHAVFFSDGSLGWAFPEAMVEEAHGAAATEVLRGNPDTCAVGA